MQYLVLFLACIATVLSEEIVQPGRVKIDITEALGNRSNWQNLKIVGGTPVPNANKYPFAAAYLSNTFQFCGASIISEYYALTAAHCISSANPSNEWISIGSLRYDGNGNPSSTYHSVVRTIIHPNFNRGNLDYDAALLELATPISFTGTMGPIDLARGSNPYDDDESVCVGWGTTSEGGSASQVLREVDLPIISNSYCSEMYNGITPRMLCAYQPGKDSCQGDSGGPLFVELGDEYLQVGIVSWGIGCAGVGAPGVYARVSTIVSWVDSIVGRK